MKLLLLCTMIFISISGAHAKIYKIKAGKHSSGAHFGVVIKKVFAFRAKFDSSAEYYLGNVNQLDTNKLLGFSDCYSSHHKNSARFGWRWNEQLHKVDILAYSYNHGQREIKLVDSIDIDKLYDFKIVINKYDYEFQLNDKKVTTSRGCSQTHSHGYKLFPYFGGDEVAPHDIKIEIK